MYLQTTTAECGLACLGFVAAHHGASLKMSELRARFAVSARGMTLTDLVRLAGMMGLSARPLRLELDELAELAVPCILHWDLNHFVVLKKYSRGRITIHDPAHGERVIPLAQVSGHFTGVALELSPAAGFERPISKPPVSWRQLIGRVGGLRRSLSQIFLLAAVLQILSLLAPLFTQWIVDGAIVSGDVGLVWVLIVGFVLVVVTRVALEAARGWLGIVASTQFGFQWVARVMRHLLHLPVQWFELRQTGDVVSRFQSTQNIQQTITGRLVEIFLDGLFALATLLVMLLYSAPLAAIVLVAVIGYALIRILPHGALHRVNDEVLVHEARAQTHFLESLRAMQTIKLSGLQDQRVARWLNLVAEATNRRVVSQKMTLAFSAGYGLIFGLESAAILGWGASMAVEGAISVGMLMAFVTYKDEFSARMQRFIDNLMAVRMLRLHVERLSDIVLSDQERIVGTLPQKSDDDKWLEPSVRLEEVSFRYGHDSAWILRNVDLEIRAGEHVAIIGATGCGKTTLVKLILGLLEPTEGKIYTGSLPLQQAGLSNWRAQAGAVMQDDQLFSASIQENIAGFDECLDFERVQAAATLAAIHDEILAMPMGYHTLVGDMGNNLSGGQKQRVILARALYRQPRVLVLDEATSHLDVAREQEVNAALRGLSITRILIAHRPESIASADRVIDLSHFGVLPRRSISNPSTVVLQ